MRLCSASERISKILTKSIKYHVEKALRLLRHCSYSHNIDITLHKRDFSRRVV